MSYYHYTKGTRLQSIIVDGRIKTTDAVLDKKEKPAAWLTKSSKWEKACNVGKVINHKELVSGQIYSSDDIQIATSTDDYMQKEIGMCRILISESIKTVSWAKFKHVSGITEKVYNAVDSYSRNIGCPVGKWLCTFSAIPEKYWEGIEMLVGKDWVRWDGEIPIEEFVELCLSCNK